MKQWIDLWNREFAPAVARRLSVNEREVEWSPAEELPPAEDALVVVLRWEGSGPWQGSVTLITAQSEAVVLLAPASGGGRPAKRKSTPAESDETGAAKETAARWLEWLRAVVVAMPWPELPSRMEPGLRPQSAPLFPYVLRLGGQSIRMAMICDLAERPKAREQAAEEAGPALLPAAPTANLDLLLDIEVDASLRFGSRELAIRELLETGPGDVLELDRHITDPVDLVVGDKIVARGEVVLVNGNFGLRVTEVAEPKKCLESVRCLF